MPDHVSLPLEDERKRSAEVQGLGDCRREAPERVDVKLFRHVRRCHGFISALPQGYDTVLEEGGASLSGGERQRISIARAILKDAPIVILDEATSSVDPENEHDLIAALSRLTAGKTVISIAHRLNTVATADQILVLDAGRIVQRGRHGQLMEEEGLYRSFIELRRAAAGWTIGG